MYFELPKKRWWGSENCTWEVYLGDQKVYLRSVWLLKNRLGGKKSYLVAWKSYPRLVQIGVCIRVCCAFVAPRAEVRRAIACMEVTRTKNCEQGDPQDMTVDHMIQYKVGKIVGVWSR